MPFPFITWGNMTALSVDFAQLPAIQTVQGDCWWALKTGKIGLVSQQCITTRGNPNLYLDQPIKKGDASQFLHLAITVSPQ